MSIQTTRRAITLDHIESICGSEMRNYAENKHRGGVSGKKGGKYENYFLAAKAGELASEYIDKPNARWPFLQGQTGGLVDDAYVETSDSTQYYQLKNVQTLSWTAGGHPIGIDFSNQFKIATELCYPEPKTCLVVPDETLKNELEKSAPTQIKPHTEVHFFPYDEDYRLLVFKSKEIQGQLSKIVTSNNPHLAALQDVFGVLINACDCHPNGCGVDQLIRHANSIRPPQLRNPPGNAHIFSDTPTLSPDFISILVKIEGLKISFSDGCVTWEATIGKSFTTAGMIPFALSSDEFQDFQTSVIRTKPKTFDDFEAILP